MATVIDTIQIKETNEPETRAGYHSIYSESGELKTKNSAGAADTLILKGSATLEGLTLDLTQDYVFSDRSTSLTLQGQTTGTSTALEIYSKDGDGTDDVHLRVIGKGVPGNIANAEYMDFEYDAASTSFKIYTEKTGSGIARDLSIYTDGNTDQLKLVSSDATVRLINSLVIPKASGNGIKVDTTTPTYTYRDLEGVELPDLVGSNRPTMSVYSGGAVRANAYSAGDKNDLAFHLPHDYVAGSDVFLHIHWSHNGTTISGNTVFTPAYQYAKGHNQSNFSTEKSQAITYATTDITTTPRYRHRIDEVQLSDSGGTGNLLDTDDLEPDGLIIMNLTMTTIPTITGGSPNEPFIHRVDIHYLSTNVGTKDKTPDFYT